MKQKGFKGLTEIQEKSIPVIASGRNALVIAPTGFGKTECALVPALDFLLKEKQAGREDGIKVLYITPMRSLNRDMLDRMKWWAKELGISISVRHGDTTQSERAKQARNPPSLLITTPETLQAILPTKYLGKALESVEKVIIDEVHELYESKRGSQLSLALERLLQKRGQKSFQRVGLSATVGQPDRVAKFLCGDRECDVVRLSVERAVKLRIESPKPTKLDKELSEKLVVDEWAAARLRLMDDLILAHKATLAFVNTRQVAETLTSRMLKLRSAQQERGIGVHHGSLSKDVRIRAEKEFKSQKIRGLLCTSSLELGVDIGQVDLVVQYTSPRQVQRLIQRVGRSGHSLDKIPKGVIIASDEDDILEAAVIARRASKGLVESHEPHSLALDVLAHQIAGVLLEHEEVKLSGLLAAFSRAYLYNKLTIEELRAVASQLSAEGNLFYDQVSDSVKPTARTRFFYYENLSTIPDERKFFVKNAVLNKTISVLDEKFVANYVQPGMTFITKGVPWKVLDVGEKEIIVEPSDDVAAAVPDWEGSEIPVPFDVANEVGELRAKVRDSLSEPKELSKIKRRYHLSQEAVNKLASFIQEQAEQFVPDDKNILIESNSDALVVHACLGSKGNEALSRVLAAGLSAKFGHSVRAKADPYRIIMQVPQADAQTVKSLLEQMSDGYAEKVLRDSVTQSRLFKYSFIHVAKSFGIISRDVDYSKISMRRIIDSLEGTPVYAENMRQFMHDYLDLETVFSLLSNMRSGEVKVKALKTKKTTPIARLALIRISAASELIAPIEPTSEILKAYKAQLLSQTGKFWCTYCNKIYYKKLKDIKGKVNCPNCGSPLVAFVPKHAKEFDSMKEKREKGKRLNKDEKKLLNDLLRGASLIDAYGRRAALALTVYGVGLDTAARILRKLHKTEGELFVDLLEAQKQFIKTKKYWSA